MIRKITWLASCVITLVLAIVLIHLIYRVNVSYNPYAAQQLATPKDVQYYIDNYVKKFSSHHEPMFVPTGLFIESLNFVSANTVHVSGNLWQRYTDKLLTKIKPGFVLPEAVGRPVIEEEYRVRENDTTTIGWHFETDIVENFDYSKFPLDHKIVKIRIFHPQDEKNVILIPDLTSYTSTAPHQTFGMDPEIVLRNFTLLNTYFEYKLTHYDTDFGIKNYVGQKNFPQLYFNIVIKRRLIDAFVTNLFPLLVVLIFTFLTLLIATSEEDKAKQHGFNLSMVLRVCSLFLFIVLLAHINLRTMISEGKIIYIEHIYFMLYVSLIYVALNAFILIKGSPKNILVKFFRYQDNLIPKALLLPCIFAFLLWISVKILLPP